MLDMVTIIKMLCEVIISLSGVLLQTISDVVVELFSLNKAKPYSAHFLSENKLFSSASQGYALLVNKNLSIAKSFENSAIFGGSGTGKSSQILIPSILTMNSSSLVIHDPSGELALKTSGAKHKLGFSVKYLNYVAIHTSEKYNPLHRIKDYSDIKKISKIIVTTSLGDGGKELFWNGMAESLLSFWISYVKYHTPKEFCNLSFVLFLLQEFAGSPKKSDERIVQTSNQQLLNEYKSFVALDSKMLLSVIATATQSLSIFSDPQMTELTSDDTIDMEGFRTQKTILYIQNNVQNMKYYKVISSIFFEQFFGLVISKLGDSKELPIFFLLDEASSLNLTNILPIAISNIRKANAGILMIYQSQSQLFDMYGASQGRNILDNSFAKVYLPGQGLEVCKELEQLMGKYEFLDENNAKVVRSLLTTDEIRTSIESIILCGNAAPIKRRLVPYYEQRNLKALSAIPYFVKPNDNTQNS
jgi:type IV secretory pathway TraG/TraD family ATPase VirD4